MAAPYRVLTILVDPRRDDVGVMTAIAHELQHVIEVWSDRRIRSDLDMSAFYRFRGVELGGAVETWTAIKMGDAVRRELRRAD